MGAIYGGRWGRVSPDFSIGGDITCHVPTLFCFKNKSDVCHVLCEELFMLDCRPYIANLMLEQNLVWYH